MHNLKIEPIFDIKSGWKAEGDLPGNTSYLLLYMDLPWVTNCYTLYFIDKRFKSPIMHRDILIYPKETTDRVQRRIKKCIQGFLKIGAVG